MKRQRGRNRGGGGGGGGGKPQQNANRAFDSSGPDNIKVRGHAQHVFEKYQQLSRDASSAGDRVLAENFLQHAEHYFRVLRTLQPNRPVADFISRDSFTSGYEIDFEDESGAQALPDEPQGEGQTDSAGENGDQPRGDYPARDGRWENRQNGQREGRDLNRNRFDRDRPPREDRGVRSEGLESESREVRDDRNGGYRDRPFRDDRPPREDRIRDDRPREDARPRDDRPRDDRAERRERSYEPRGDRADPLAVVEPQAKPLTKPAPAAPETPAPRAEEGSGVLRSRDGEISHAPAFLQAPSTAASPIANDEPPAKRPRGRPRKVKADTPEAEEA